MDKQMIHYCFILSEEQLEHLRSKKYKIDRMDCFMSLITLAVREPKLVPLSKTQQVEILPGQFIIDNTQLAKLWDKDRKTVPKILEAMESLGISSSQKVGDNRIHTLHSLSGWYENGRFHQNTFASKRNADGSGIFHANVPPAKLIIIEDEDAKKKDKDSSDSIKVKSNDDSVGEPTSSDVHITLHSSPSNDSDNVGKSSDGNNTSVSPSDNYFPK